MTREEVLERAYTEYKNSFEKLKGCTIVLQTGTGKSSLSLNCASYFKEAESILVIVPRVSMIKNWEDEIDLWAPELKSKIRISTLKKEYLNREEIDMLIIDECHMLGDNYSRIVFNKTYKKLLCVTATPMEDDDRKNNFYTSFAPIIFKFLKSEEEGIVNKINYFVIEHYLDDTDRYIDVRINKKTYKYTELKYYEYISSTYKYCVSELNKLGSRDYFGDSKQWLTEGTDRQKHIAFLYMKTVGARKRFLNTLKSTRLVTTTLCSKILKKNENAKILVMSELNEQIEKICTNYIHGSVSKEDGKEIIKKFNEGEINILGSCYSITMGQNFKKVNNLILESYNSSETTFKQRVGRLHRLKVDQSANMYIIKIMNTQSTKWFDNMISTLDKSKIRYISSNYILNN